MRTTKEVRLVTPFSASTLPSMEELRNFRTSAAAAVPEVAHLNKPGDIITTLQQFEHTGVLVTNPYNDNGSTLPALKVVHLHKKNGLTRTNLETVLRTAIFKTDNPGFIEDDFRILHQRLETMLEIGMKLCCCPLNELELGHSTSWMHGGGVHQDSYEIILTSAFRLCGTIFYSQEGMNIKPHDYVPDEESFRAKGIAWEGELLVGRGCSINYLAGEKVPDKARQSLFHRRPSPFDISATKSSHQNPHAFSSIPGRLFATVSGIPRRG